MAGWYAVVKRLAIKCFPASISTGRYVPRIISRAGSLRRATVAIRSERRWITPVQIFQVQHQRCFCGDHFERLGHLAQHSLLRRHLRESLQASAILHANETRHLRQPRWGNSMQNLNQFLAARLAAHSRQGLENRQVRLAHAILVDALPSPDTNCSIARERIGERTRQQRSRTLILRLYGPGSVGWPTTTARRAAGGNAGNGFQSISSDTIALNSPWPGCWN